MQLIVEPLVPEKRYNNVLMKTVSMLNGSLVTSAWHVLQFMGEGNGCHTWRVAVNILNKQ
jgi:hypothetical protein